jgi:hypothetical protein
MSSLPVFKRVYGLEIQSVMLEFSTPLVNKRPSNLLTGSPTPPPHPPEPTKLLYNPKQKPRRGGGLRQINTCRQVTLLVNF